MAPDVVLVGAPGSGKSTVGAALAERLGLPFTDVDTVIEQRVGRSVADIFADDGEAVFRAFEETTTIELLAAPGVLALGGGAVLSATTRAALRGHEVIWLRIGAAQAAARVGLNTARPLLLGNVRGRLVTLLAQRRPLYAEVATHALDTDGREVDDVVTEILALLRPDQVGALEERPEPPTPPQPPRPEPAERPSPRPQPARRPEPPSPHPDPPSSHPEPPSPHPDPPSSHPEPPSPRPEPVEGLEAHQLAPRDPGPTTRPEPQSPCPEPPSPRPEPVEGLEAHQLAPRPDPSAIEVRAERPYQVLVGPGVLDRLPGLLAPATRVALIHPPTLIATAAHVESLLTKAGFDAVRVDVPDAEGAKTVEVAARCWSILATAGFTRTDAVVGLGGGATTDLAGFVAATWLRGVPLVTVPTSLLAMVDAAVGGKTGINLPEGKNLVGCFWEPIAVLCDLELLPGLPPDDVTSGLAEVVKCGFIADPVILDLIESDPSAARTPDSRLLRELIERAITVKASVVSKDLRESTSTGRVSGRELLNYGHTLGHAIERHEGYRWRHGEAISVGMVFAAELSRLAGRLDAATADRHRAILGRLGLATTYRADAYDDLLAAMAVDKKTRGATLRFVVLDRLAEASILTAPSDDLLRAAYATLIT